MSIPRILIIGSGAVGAVYGHHLAMAACRPTYLIRDTKSDNSKMPRTLHRYSLVGKKIDSRQQHLRTITLGCTGWDQVWICLPSSAIESPWLLKQLALLDPYTPIILWSPDFRDRDILQKHYSGPISRALIGIISFQTPLPGENTPSEGIAYVAPPRSAVLEDSEAGNQAAAWLKAGGLPTAINDNLALHEARMTALLQPVIAALEITQWSLKKLRQSQWLSVATKAAREAKAVGETYLGKPPSRSIPGQHFLLKTAISVAPTLLPFPLEPYLRYHFSKVSEQTRIMLDGWIEQGKISKLPITSLEALRSALP
ncbi:MAG: 2-dehydropantoate 2-reductase N-terminal domain-containing protein [Alcanivoracaceae bacterium]|nr:2-dehydropantoate 2-reductase N-terminal domain-containing protein [Alcanivoracaceae bacterium]